MQSRNLHLSLCAAADDDGGGTTDFIELIMNQSQTKYARISIGIGLIMFSR